MKKFKFFKKSSKNIAKERLSQVLISDRAQCAPNVLENIKIDMAHTLAKYKEVNTEKIDFKVIAPGQTKQSLPVLVAYIPFKELSESEPKEKHA